MITIIFHPFLLKQILPIFKSKQAKNVMIKHKDRIITIISMFFPQAKIYLFGSYARGDYSRSSDIDIAIDNGQPITLLQKAQIANMIDVLNLTQNVDVVDFQSVPKHLQEKILKEGIVLKELIDQKTLDQLLEIVEIRNRTTHVYDEKAALEMSKMIITYYEPIKILIEKLSQK